MSSPIAPGARPLPQVSSHSIGSPVRRDPVIDRSQVPKEVIQVAEGFEEMFLEYLMKTMRDTIPDNPMSLESNGTRIYRSMLDTEYTKKAMAAGGVGVADQLIAYLAPQAYTLRDAAPHGMGANGAQGAVTQPAMARVTTPAQRGTGGTYESQFVQHAEHSGDRIPVHKEAD